MEEAAKEAVESDYDVLVANCIDVASDALRSAGLNPGYSTTLNETGLRLQTLNPAPNARYQEIKNNNQGSVLDFLGLYGNSFPIQKEPNATVTVGSLSPPVYNPDDKNGN